MYYNDCIRNKPWLSPCHINNICNRLLEKTNGNAFIVYNKIRQSCELHTVESYRLSGDSFNATIPVYLLNEFIISDYNATNYAHSVDDAISDQMYSESLHDRAEQSRRPQELKEQLKIIERVMGTRV